MPKHVVRVFRRVSRDGDCLSFNNSLDVVSVPEAPLKLLTCVALQHREGEAERLGL